MHEHVRLGERDAVNADAAAVHHHCLARQPDDALHDAATELG